MGLLEKQFGIKEPTPLKRFENQEKYVKNDSGKKLLNPYLGFAKTSRENKLQKRLEKRCTYDWGRIVYYIVPEVVKLDELYGEFKLKYNEFFEMPVGFTDVDQDLAENAVIYGLTGSEFTLDASFVIDINQEYFEECVMQHLEAKHLNVEKFREGPSEGDLFIFKRGFMDGGETDGYEHIWPNVYEITNVAKMSDINPWAEPFSWRCTSKPWRKSAEDVITDELKDDLFDNEEKLEPPYESDKVDDDKTKEVFSDEKIEDELDDETLRDQIGVEL